MRDTPTARTFHLCNLERFRLARGWERPELARRSSVPVRYIRELERSQTVPSFEVAVRLAEALELPDPRVLADPLFGGQTIRASVRRQRVST